MLTWVESVGLCFCLEVCHVRSRWYEFFVRYLLLLWKSVGFGALWGVGLFLRVG